VSDSETTNDSQTFILIDGLSLIYRAYYAFIRNPLMNRDGQPTSAIFGFARFLIKILSDFRPGYIALALDAGRETFRTEIFPDYKAQREAMPDDLKTQIPMIVELVESMGIMIFSMKGFEADDLIGTLAEKAVGKPVKTIIFTGDKDFLQLVGNNVTVIRTIKGLSKTRVYDEFGFREEYGIEPSQFVDVKALAGDSSDNIPGVPGVGEKTALNLIRQFGSIDHLLENLSEVKGDKRRKVLQENTECLFQGRLLCTIRRDVPLEADFERLKRGVGNVNRALELLDQYDLHSLKDEIRSLLPGDEEKLPGETAEKSFEVTTVLDDAGLESLVSALAECDTFSLLPVVKDSRPFREDLIGIALASPRGQAWYIPLGHMYLGVPEQLRTEQVIKVLKPLLATTHRQLVCFDYKLAIRTFTQLGANLSPPVFDTFLAAHLLEPAGKGYNPEHLSEHYLPDGSHGARMNLEEAVDFLKKHKNIDEIPVETATSFFGCRALDVFHLYKPLENLLEQEQLLSIFSDIELPLSPVLADMETAGITIDPSVLRELSRQATETIDHIQRKIFDESNCTFNVNSPKQLAEVLYDKMQLPQFRSKPSTAAEVLKELSTMGHGIADLVLTFREMTKLRNTYLETLPQEILPATGRVHTTFHQTITATGRLSSSDPNLQNIPIRGAMGKQVRRAFVPKEEWIFLSLDYSQIELRILAHITGDPVLMKAFLDDCDVHTATAAEIFSVPPADVTRTMRREAKVVNFGIIYGMSSYGLAQELRIPIPQAQNYIKRYFERYPKVAEYTSEIIEQAVNQGYVTTLLGRKRFIPELKSKNKNTRSFGERVAINAPIQGTSADLIKKAMIEIHQVLGASNRRAKMLLQIHDELLFELPPGELTSCLDTVRPIMKHAITLDVPVILEVKTGRNWLDQEAVSEPPL